MVAGELMQTGAAQTCVALLQNKQLVNVRLHDRLNVMNTILAIWTNCRKLHCIMLTSHVFPLKERAGACARNTRTHTRAHAHTGYSVRSENAAAWVPYRHSCITRLHQALGLSKPSLPKFPLQICDLIGTLYGSVHMRWFSMLPMGQFSVFSPPKCIEMKGKTALEQWKMYERVCVCSQEAFSSHVH
eukprot:1147513-Pelagomonas_calceolata.AAC.3